MTFHSFQQPIARLLLISLCLQSCGGGFDNNPLIPTGKEQTAHLHTNTQQIIPPTNVQLLVGQELTAQGGHAVIFREEDGQLKADVKVNTHPGFSKSYIDLEVVLEQNTDLARLPYLHKKSQERHIYLQLATTNKPAKVIIYKEAGGMGGMKEGDKGKTKRKEKQK